MPTETLLSIAVLGRVVVACCFRGFELTYARKRDLSVDVEAAVYSVGDFVRDAIADLRPDLIAVELRAKVSPRRASFVEAACKASVDAGVPCWKVAECELLASFGEPPIAMRGELRRVIRELCPILSYCPRLAPGSYDAAALGLHVQVASAIQRAEAEGSDHAG